MVIWFSILLQPATAFIAKELDAELISIPQVINQDSLVFEADKIGIVCPIYGHEMPEMVKDFIRRAEFKTDYFYIIGEKNPDVRYRNENITLEEIIKANNQH